MGLRATKFDNFKIQSQLSKETDSRKRMLPTCVDSLPDGRESGNYIVLDFGGRFFRIAYVNIKEEERIIKNHFLFSKTHPH